MQGFERADRQLLDTAALAGHLVPPGSMFAFLAAHRAGVFPDVEYPDLFAPAGTGRPSVPATQMAAVMTLQALHDYSDRETAEAVKFDVRWKAAIGAALDDPGFDRVRTAGQAGCAYPREPGRTAVKCNPNCNPVALRCMTAGSCGLPLSGSRDHRLGAATLIFLCDQCATPDWMV